MDILSWIWELIIVLQLWFWFVYISDSDFCSVLRSLLRAWGLSVKNKRWQLKFNKLFNSETRIRKSWTNLVTFISRIALRCLKRHCLKIKLWQKFLSQEFTMQFCRHKNLSNYRVFFVHLKNRLTMYCLKRLEDQTSR